MGWRQIANVIKEIEQTDRFSGKENFEFIQTSSRITLRNYDVCYRRVQIPSAGCQKSAGLGNLRGEVLDGLERSAMTVFAI